MFLRTRSPFAEIGGLQNLRLGAAESLPDEDAQFDLVTAFDVVDTWMMMLPASFDGYENLE